MKDGVIYSLNNLDTTPKEVNVSLFITRSDLNPDEVTALMGLVPFTSRRRGDLLPLFNTASEFGSWRFSSKPNVDSLNLDEHLGWLFGQIRHKDEALQSLKSQGYKRFVKCYWLTQAENAEPRLRFEFMRRLSELELDFYFDVYHEDLD